MGGKGKKGSWDKDYKGYDDEEGGYKGKGFKSLASRTESAFFESEGKTGKDSKGKGKDGKKGKKGKDKNGEPRDSFSGVVPGRKMSGDNLNGKESKKKEK